jgi:tetratricopeptide (TPR) repeat protein
MRIKQIFWVLAAFVFTGVLYAQRGGMQGVPVPSQPVSPTSQQSQQQISVQSQAQTEQKGKKAQGSGEMSEKELTKEIKSSPPETVIKDVKERGVDFNMDQDTEKKLRKAKATDAVIDAVKQAGPKAREQAKLAPAQGQAGVQGVPPEQAQAFGAIKGELDPDKAIALVDDFAKKYPNSVVLSYVYAFGANAYQQKGDLEKLGEYSDKSLKLDPDNIMTLVMRVNILPQPQYLNDHEADRDKVLQEATSEGNHALQLISKLPKLTNEADADREKRLADVASQVHGSLGMVHLELATGSLAGPDKAELVKAEQEFNTAVTTAIHPDPRDYFRLGETYRMDGKLDDAIQAFTKAGELGQGTMIKTYADQQIAEMNKRKAQVTTAPNPK